MGTVHELLIEQGKQEALKSEHDRRVIEAAASYLSAEDHDIGFLYSGWAQAALPHKRLADDALWQVQTDRIALIVQPGFRAIMGGEPIPVGVPYGSRARLILLYLQTEALRTKTREIELGRSLHHWLNRLDIPIGGKSMRDVRDQAERISHCRMSFQIMQGTSRGLVNQSIVDTAMFVEDGGSRQGSLSIETATLSQTFYDQLSKHPVPIEEAAVKSIANNSLALDVYCWLAYRLHALQTPMAISWKALHLQFGRGVSRIDHFVSHFRVTLQLATAVYPDAKVEIGGKGIVLHPSPPPVKPKTSRLSLAISR